MLRPLPALCCLALLAAPARAGITGVCPDGSIFIVQHEAQIPCRDAKRIDPHETPPVRPEYLPRPYTWQVYNEKNDPNNAYNLIDQARQVRELRDERMPPSPTAGQGAGGETPSVSAPPPRASRGRRAGPVDLGLTDGELRDLFVIVELSQEDAPARFLRQSAGGAEEVRVQLAHSEAFEGRFADAWRGHGPPGRVLLFSAVAREAGPFYANFTFVQEHLAFQPKIDDPEQFGLIEGRLGPLDADAVVLGYVVLPERMDPSHPMDVYWNDRRIEAVFRP